MKYEEEVKRLEQIVQQMERGDLDIDQLTEQLKEAQRIIKSCKAVGVMVHREDLR